MPASRASGRRRGTGGNHRCALRAASRQQRRRVHEIGGCRDLRQPGLLMYWRRWTLGNQRGRGASRCLHQRGCDRANWSAHIRSSNHVRLGLDAGRGLAIVRCRARATQRRARAGGRLGARGKLLLFLRRQGLIGLPSRLTIRRSQLLRLLELEARRTALLRCHRSPLGHSRLNTLALVHRHGRELRGDLQPFLLVIRTDAAPIALQRLQRRLLRGRKRLPVRTALGIQARTLHACLGGNGWRCHRLPPHARSNRYHSNRQNANGAADRIGDERHAVGTQSRAVLRNSTKPGSL